MYPALNIGPLVLPTAAFIIIAGGWLSLAVVERAARLLGLKPEPVYGVAATGLVAGVVGARLAFVLQYWPAYQENLLAIVWPINSGYNAAAGLLVGATAAFFYGRARRLEPLPTLDALAPGLLTALIFVSLADLLGGPGYGEVTSMPWGIEQFEIRRHPVQLYEIAAASIALIVWLWLVRRRRFAGQLFLTTTIVYGLGRMLADTYRATTWLTENGLHVWQMLSLAAALLALYFLARLSQEQAPAGPASPRSPHGPS